MALSSIYFFLFALVHCDIPVDFGSLIKSRFLRLIALVFIGMAYLAVVGLSPFSQDTKADLNYLAFLTMTFGALRHLKYRVGRLSFLLGILLCDSGLLVLLRAANSIVAATRLPPVPGSFLVYPPIILLIVLYLNANLYVLDKQKFILANWTLLAYAFPEAQMHNRARPRPDEPQLGLIDIVSALVTIGLFLLAFFLSFWLSQFHFAVITLAVSSTAVVAFYWKCLSRDCKVTSSKKLLLAMAFGSSASGLLILLFSLLIGFEIWHRNDVPLRLMRSFVLGIPMYIIVTQYGGNLLQWIRVRPRKSGEKRMFFEILLKTAVAIKVSQYGAKRSIRIQALVIASVFILYLLAPLSPSILEHLGVREWGAVDLAAGLRAIQTFGPVTIGKAQRITLNPLFVIFAEQGLILIVVMWSMVTFMMGALAHGKLAKIPSFSQRKWNTKLLGVFTYVLPFGSFIYYIFLVAVTTPILFAALIGPSVSLLIGALTFSVFFPQIASFLAGVLLQLHAGLGIDKENERVNVNTASRREIERLPGIGKEITTQIISSRPFEDFQDFFRKINHLEPSIQNILRNILRF
jgi:hypothetical protein